MPWEDIELDVDEDELIQQVLDGIGDRIEGWEANEGAPEVALGEEVGVLAAWINARIVEAQRLAIAGIGETYFQIVARTASYAVIPDAAIHLFVEYHPSEGDHPATISRDVSIPAGFTIVADGVAFQTAEDIVGPVTFDDSTDGFGKYEATLHVAMTATAPGTAGNVAELTPVTIISSARYVTAMTIVEDAAGGSDEESLTDYLTRVTDYLSTLRPGGVLAADLAALARTVSGVHRAIGMDLYDPAEEDPQERTATVIAIDAAGDPVDGVAADELQEVLEASREVNFNIILAEPTYTGVDIVVEVDAAAGIDHGDLEDQLTAAIGQLISPAGWGSSTDDPRAWAERTVLRPLDVAAVVGQVPGVLSIEDVTINGAGTAVTLPGPAALPSALDATTDPSTISVVVS